MQEEWRDVPGYEWRFQASNLGRIRSIRLLSPAVKSTGYESVGVRNKTSVYVHDLVARAFIGARPQGYDINHKDGHKRHNKPSNLEYVTRKENNHHAWRTGLLRHSLTEKQMDIISDMFFVQGKSVSEIGRKIKRHKNVIRSVIGIWRAKDRKGKRNPYEHKLDETKAYKVVEMYMQGGVTQAQVAAAFGCHPAHVSRVINGIMWPSALQRYTDHHALKGAE